MIFNKFNLTTLLYRPHLMYRLHMQKTNIYPCFTKCEIFFSNLKLYQMSKDNEVDLRDPLGKMSL